MAIQQADGPHVLSPSDLRALLAAPDGRTRLGRRDAALIAILVGGGLRQSEARTLKGSNVSQEDGRMRLTFRTLKSRDERYRTVTLPTWAAAPVSRYLARTKPRAGAWLFAGQKGEPLSLTATERIVDHYLAVIGRDGSDGRRRLRPHSLRHTYGAMITRLAGIFAAQRLLGHASPDTTARYYSAWLFEEGDNAADKLSGVTRQRRSRQT